MTTAIIIIAGVGLVAAVALAVADRYLSVKEDPRIGMVTAALPGANCGGCGFPGCDGYARALVAGTAANGACAAGGAACAEAVSKILGVAAAATERRVAVVHCCGTRSNAIRVGDYNGIAECPTLSNPRDCSPPASSVHGIFQVRTLEWAAIPLSRGSS